MCIILHRDKMHNATSSKDTEIVEDQRKLVSIPECINTQITLKTVIIIIIIIINCCCCCCCCCRYYYYYYYYDYQNNASVTLNNK